MQISVVYGDDLGNKSDKLYGFVDYFHHLDAQLKYSMQMSSKFDYKKQDKFYAIK